ncbi:DUF2461 domain-containing protein [Allorhizocola rhizosphaerae]|uniref:DUF2461 domain-containing protein n=1 Tax=Allorhizocola rhizosphaerae TaxID=1872709 RepID=UPI000E3E0270|nr:DUF2461 domain-containing protein [Allorhizocola rhizosphaerae]
MGFSGFTDEATLFYEGLMADNSKTYWTAHKDVYERAVRRPMQELLDELAPAFDADVTLFRPYRDVRFSKDKSPYKTHQGGFLEVVSGVGYYVQIDAEGVLVGGGFHAHDREQIARYRSAVDAPGSGKQLADIVGKLEKAGFEIGGEQVKTRPRGVAPDHPRLDLMRREYVTAGRKLAPEQATVASVKKDWRRLVPLIEWVQENAPPT